jgi:hypothetical protein
MNQHPASATKTFLEQHGRVLEALDESYLEELSPWAKRKP